MHFDKFYSHYYDIFYEKKEYEEEVHNLEKLIKSYLPNSNTILDLGCGSGRHAIIFAEKGYTVDGLDLSPNMLELAKIRKNSLPKKARDNIEFKLGDARNFNFDKKYDVILALFHVTSYLTTNDDILNMFKCVDRHLAPGGIFIFDYWYGPAVLTEKPTVKVKRLESDQFKVVRIAEPDLKTNVSLVDVHYEIFVKNKKSNEHSQFNEIHSMRYFFLNEINFLLEQSGLRILNSVELITGKPPGLDTWGICSIAKK